MMIDTHTHVWGPSTDEHPWVHEKFAEVVSNLPIPTVYRAEELLDDMEAAGVDEAVVVGFPIYEWTDNWYTSKAVAEHDELLGIGLVDPFAHSSSDHLRDLLEPDGMIGFRLGILYAQDARWQREAPEATWLLDAVEEVAFWEAAREKDAVVQILCDQSQLDQVRRLVETYPDLTYVIDHLARADPDSPPMDSVFREFKTLADFDGVFPKISALPFLSSEGYPYADLHDHVRTLLEWFGSDHLVWGSDYQFECDLTTYCETKRWMDEATFLSKNDVEWITSRTFHQNILP